MPTHNKQQEREDAALLTAEQRNLATLLKLAATGNKQPNHAEANFLREWWESFDGPLTELDLETRRLSQQLAALAQRKEALLRLRTAYSDKLSAVRRIPAEILQEIFGWFGGTDPFGRYLTRRRDGVWSIERVCSSWRRAVISYPPLWNDLGVISLGRACELRDPLAMLQLNLERVGHLRTLSFILEDHTPYRSTTEDQEIAASIIRVLVARHKDWQRVSFCVPNRLEHTFRPLHGADLPLLETLYISSGLERLADPVSGALDLSALPSLHTITFESPVCIDLPWDNITCVTSGSREVSTNLSIAHSQEVLDLCINLQSFHQITDGSGLVPPLLNAFPERIRNDSLSSLRIMGPAILLGVTLPGLKELYIDSVNKHRGISPILAPALEQIRDFIRASGCSLTLLSLVDCHFNNIFTDVFKECPELETLSIRYWSFPSEYGMRTMTENCLCRLAACLSNRVLVTAAASLLKRDEDEAEEDEDDDDEWQGTETEDYDDPLEYVEEESDDDSEDGGYEMYARTGHAQADDEGDSDVPMEAHSEALEFMILPQLRSLTLSLSDSAPLDMFSGSTFVDMVQLRCTEDEAFRLSLEWIGYSPIPARVISSLGGKYSDQVHIHVESRTV